MNATIAKKTPPTQPTLLRHPCSSQPIRRRKMATPRNARAKVSQKMAGDPRFRRMEEVLEGGSGTWEGE